MNQSVSRWLIDTKSLALAGDGILSLHRTESVNIVFATVLQMAFSIVNVTDIFLNPIAISVGIPLGTVIIMGMTFTCSLPLIPKDLPVFPLLNPASKHD